MKNLDVDMRCIEKSIKNRLYSDILRAQTQNDIVL